jgi:predicted phosphodiesterase
VKLQILSDPHLESHAFTLKIHPEADALVLAGDIAAPSAMARRVALLKKAADQLPVLIVPGNHDYYHSSIAEGMTKAQAVVDAIPGVIDLSLSSWGWDDILFVGATLWSDFRLPFWYDGKKESRPQLAKKLAYGGINDFAFIKGFNPDIAAERHETERAYLLDMIRTHAGGRVVVVTHFLPSERSIDPVFERSPLNAYFASNCEELMQPNVKLWIHGHTHASCDYKIGDTRVVCNPRGYTKAENPRFSSQFLVEV